MLKKKRPLHLRMAAGILAMLLISIIAFLTNLFIGNPISAFFAGQKMKKYVVEKYPDMDLGFTKTQYNFKFTAYTLRAINPDSPDTHFMVIYESDGSIYDNYEDYVLSGFNTLDRLGEEMTLEIEPLLKDLFGSELVGRCFADCFGKNKDLTKAPPLDTPFNRNMVLNASIFLDFAVEEPSLEYIATQLIRADELLTKEGFSVGEYIVEALNPKTKKGYSLQVDRKMIDEHLPKAMEDMLNSEEYDERLSVYRMK